jgi:putative PIN family toxin of toxin-antitoxin system
MRAANETLRVVFDTNVLLSAIGFRGSVYRLWEAAFDGRFQLFTSAFILEELQRNLLAKSRLTRKEVDAWISLVRRVAVRIEPDFRLAVVTRHDEDNRILECAVAARAHYLVTGNMKDLRPLGSFQGIEIISPREFITRISA